MLTKEFPGIEVHDQLTVALSSKTDSPAVLCGIELIAEESLQQ